MNFKKLIEVIITFSTLISIVICLLGTKLIMTLMPIVFLLIYFLFLRKLRKYSFPITYYLFTILSFIRMTLIPLFIASSNDFFIDNVRLGRSNIDLGIYLTIYEFITMSTVFYLVNKYFYTKEKNISNYTLLGSRIFYLFVIGGSLLILLLFPEVRSTIGFFVIKSNDGERLIENVDFINILLRQFVVIALILLFLMTSFEFYKLNKLRNSAVYLIFPLLTGILNISVIIGERRSIQVYTLIISTYILAILYKKYQKLLINSMLLVGIIILAGMTIYKEFYAFSYGGYVDAVEANIGNESFPIADRLQAYFYGIHSISANIDLVKYSDLTISHLLYDSVRSITGSSLFIKSSMPLTSQIYNQVLFGKDIMTGQLFSSSGYGMIYLGAILAPIFSLINIIFCCIVERFMRKTKYLEIIYLLGFIVLRIGFNLFSYPAPIINQITLIAFPFGIVIVLSLIWRKIFTKKVGVS